MHIEAVRYNEWLCMLWVVESEPKIVAVESKLLKCF